MAKANSMLISVQKGRNFIETNQITIIKDEHQIIEEQITFTNQTTLTLNFTLNDKDESFYDKVEETLRREGVTEILNDEFYYEFGKKNKPMTLSDFIAYQKLFVSSLKVDEDLAEKEYLPKMKEIMNKYA